MLDLCVAQGEGGSVGGDQNSFLALSRAHFSPGHTGDHVPGLLILHVVWGELQAPGDGGITRILPQIISGKAAVECLIRLCCYEQGTNPHSLG